MPTIPSKRELDQRNEFTLLPDDDYKLVVENVEEKIEINKFYVEPVEGEKAKKNQKKEIQVVNITFNILSLKDGSPATDIKGGNAYGRKMWFKAKPEAVGFMADGTPSKTRCLIAYLTGSDIYGEVSYNSWKDFIGEEINAEIMQRPVGTDKKINVITRFLPPKRIQAARPINTDDIPIIEEGPNGTKGVNPEIQARRDEGKVKFPPEQDEIDVRDIPF